MILGLDLSLNHSGAVALDESGKLSGYWFVGNRKGAVDRSSGSGTRLPPRTKGMDADQHQLDRIGFYADWLWMLIRETGAEYAGVEGYAYAAVSNSSYQYGELGGEARRVLTKASCLVRIHDPLSVKMFGAVKGNATPDQVLEAVPWEYREEWLHMEHGLKGQQAAEDLAAAFWIARMVWTEIEVRAGRILLSDLEEHQVRVFNRVTKAYPVNLLGRDWLKR